ncbi:MAG: antitoxin Xre/MbcA/ParS toxin-binding domain-containing protein [Gammaproteobacteria bacterium]
MWNPENESSRLYQVLGGARVLGKSPLPLSDLIETGVPYRACEQVARLVDLTQAEQARLLGIAPRSLIRLRQAKKRLAPVAGDRLVRVARILSELLALWHDDEERVRRWLREPNTVLGERRPLDLLNTDPGVRRVENVIGTLKYGGLA